MPIIDFDKLPPNQANWVPICVADPAFEQPVQEVNEHLSTLGSDYFFDIANQAPISEDGTQYAVVGGGKDASQNTAIVMPTPFGNGVWPHIAARAEAVSHMAARHGLRDNSGNLVPVLLTAAPSKRSTFALNPQELELVRAGDFMPIAARHIKLLQALGIEALRGSIFYSGSAPVAAPMISELNSKFECEVGNVVIGEPPHSVNRSVLKALINFATEGKYFKKELQAEKIEVIDKIFASGHATPDFAKGIVTRFSENLAIVKGFKHADLTKDLLTLDNLNIQTFLLHTDKSHVAPYEEIKSVWRQAQVAGSSRHGGKNLRRVEVIDTNHSLADRVGRFSVLCAAMLAA